MSTEGMLTKGMLAEGMSTEGMSTEPNFLFLTSELVFTLKTI